MKHTNLKGIKDIAKLLFDAVKITSNVMFKWMVQHPFTNNSLVMVPKNTKGIKDYIEEVNQKLWQAEHPKSIYLTNKSEIEWYKNLKDRASEEIPMIDVTIDSGTKVFRNHIFNLIDKAKNLNDILILLNNPWYMTFLKYVEPYLSDKDLGSLLGECWVMQEYPNRDKNVDLKEIIKWFKRADVHTLMSDEEFKAYSDLFLNVSARTVYRGVSHDGKPRGLSWTLDIDKAKWFSTRFGDNNSRVYKMVITNPEHILSIFLGRNESEVVVDITKCHNWEVIE